MKKKKPLIELFAIASRLIHALALMIDHFF